MSYSCSTTIHSHSWRAARTALRLTSHATWSNSTPKAVSKCASWLNLATSTVMKASQSITVMLWFSAIWSRTSIFTFRRERSWCPKVEPRRISRSQNQSTSRTLCIRRLIDACYLMSLLLSMRLIRPRTAVILQLELIGLIKTNSLPTQSKVGKWSAYSTLSPVASFLLTTTTLRVTTLQRSFCGISKVNPLI
jgi:hypothetical protein